MRQVVDGFLEFYFSLSEFRVVSFGFLKLCDDVFLPLTEIIRFFNIEVVLLQPLIENSLFTLWIILSDGDCNEAEEDAD